MKRAHGQQIFRAKFSAVTAKDIEAAMRTLGAPNENESKAVEARQEMDLKIGVAFSRFQTKYFQGKYGDLDSAVISYGPCQTPTLGFCVERHDEIKCFTPEPFWSLDVHVEIGGRSFSLDWKRRRLFDEDIAGTLLHTLRVRDESWRDLYVTALTRSETRRSRPAPMNTVTLLKHCSSLLGIGPQSAMRAAEHLYLSGYLSYPRTESTAYPSSFDIRGTLAIVRSHPHLGEYSNELIRDGHNHAKAGVDAGDHPPITPVGMPNLSLLSSEEGRVFDLVVQHFLASVSRDAKFLVTKATFSSTPPSSSASTSASSQQERDCVEEFMIVGREELEPGFTRVYGRQQTSAEYEEGEDDDEGGGVEQTLPSQIAVGMRCRVTSAKLRKGQTTVPGYLTESELIGKMEKNGIGTDASIPTHINNILVRNYVTLGPGRTLVPTGLGVVLVHGYYRIDPDLVLPDVRATIERFCDMIAKGVASKDEVVSHSLRNFQNKFIYYSENIGAMDSLFEASFSPLAATGKFLSKCGKCLVSSSSLCLSPLSHTPSLFFVMTYPLPPLFPLTLGRDI
jgi:DNA topoisomerase III